MAYERDRILDAEFRKTLLTGIKDKFPITDLKSMDYVVVGSSFSGHQELKGNSRKFPKSKVGGRGQERGEMGEEREGNLREERGERRVWGRGRGLASY